MITGWPAACEGSADLVLSKGSRVTVPLSSPAASVSAMPLPRAQARAGQPEPSEGFAEALTAAEADRDNDRPAAGPLRNRTATAQAERNLARALDETIAPTATPAENPDISAKTKDTDPSNEAPAAHPDADMGGEPATSVAGQSSLPVPPPSLPATTVHAAVAPESPPTAPAEPANVPTVTTPVTEAVPMVPPAISPDPGETVMAGPTDIAPVVTTQPPPAQGTATGSATPAAAVVTASASPADAGSVAAASETAPPTLPAAAVTHAVEAEGQPIGQPSGPAQVIAQTAPTPAQPSVSQAAASAGPTTVEGAPASAQPKAAELAPTEARDVASASSKPQARPDTAGTDQPADQRAEKTPEAQTRTPDQRLETRPAADPTAPRAAEAAPQSTQTGTQAQSVQIQPMAGQTPSGLAADVAARVGAQTMAAGSSAVPLNAVAVTVAARALAGATRFDLKLEPQALGRIDVTMTLDKEGRVKSKMVVEKQETLDLLLRDQRSLEKALSAAGLKAEDGSIEFSLRQDGGSQTTDRQHARHDRETDSATRTRGDASPEDAPIVGTASVIYARLAAARGGIDIRI